MTLVLFKPLKIKENKFVDVPLLEMNKFIMYELNTAGLQTFVAGKSSLRYANRYIVNEIDFTDNSKKFISNMKADLGVYKNNILNLKGNITYIREDGLEVKSKSMVYNTKTSIVKTDEEFKSYLGENQMSGSSMIYDSVKRNLKSKNVTMIYKLQESK